MKNIIFFFGMRLSLQVNADSSCPAFNPTSQFSLHEKFLTLVTTLEVQDQNSEPLGKVTEKYFSIRAVFILRNTQDQIVAQAEKELFSWGSHIDIYDCHHQKIGAVKEDILQNLFSFSTTYQILNADNQEIAESVKPFHIGDTHIEIGHNGRQIVTLNRPWMSFTDNWKVSVNDPNIVDPRILVMIGAYKTFSDNKRNRDSSDNEK